MCNTRSVVWLVALQCLQSSAEPATSEGKQSGTPRAQAVSLSVDLIRFFTKSPCRSEKGRADREQGEWQGHLRRAPLHVRFAEPRSLSLAREQPLGHLKVLMLADYVRFPVPNCDRAEGLPLPLSPTPGLLEVPSEFNHPNRGASLPAVTGKSLKFVDTSQKGGQASSGEVPCKLLAGPVLCTQT